MLPLILGDIADKQFRRCYTKSFVCLSLRLSVTLRYLGRIGWNYSKIISYLIRFLFTLCKPRHHRSTLKGTVRNTPNFGRNRVGYKKSGCRRTKALISLKRGKMGPRLLLRTSRKPHTRFTSMPKSTTLDTLYYALCLKTRAPCCC